MAAAPSDINIGFKIVSVTNVSTTDETFDSHIRIIAQWKDASLAGLSPKDEVPADSWDPQLYIKNVVGELEELSVSKSIRSNEGDMKLAWEVRGTFSAPQDLHFFPFDCQELPLIIRCGVKKMSTDKLSFSTDPERQTILQTTGLSEWELLKPLAYPSTSDPSESSKGNLYPQLEIRLRVARLWGFYLWNIALPTFIVASLGLSAFGIAPEDLADRMSVTLTLLLTAVAFKSAVADNLPKIPYLTMIDVYLLINFSFLYAIALENWLVTYIEDETKLDDTDKAYRNVMIGIYVGLHVIASIYLIFRKLAGPPVPRYSKDFETQGGMLARIISRGDEEADSKI